MICNKGSDRTAAIIAFILMSIFVFVMSAAPWFAFGVDRVRQTGSFNATPALSIYSIVVVSDQKILKILSGPYYTDLALHAISSRTSQLPDPKFETMQETQIPTPKHESGLRKNIRLVCTFAIAFSGYLFWAKPTTVPIAIAFRVSLTILGLGGLLFLFLTRQKSSPVRNDQ